jgi:hypothetical protein
MKLFEQLKEQIVICDGSKAGVILANALASACNLNYAVNLVDVSVMLDADNKALVARLCRVTFEPDFSNTDQSMAMDWLRDNKYIE